MIKKKLLFYFPSSLVEHFNDDSRPITNIANKSVEIKHKNVNKMKYI